jgi:hypothetical protein
MNEGIVIAEACAAVAARPPSGPPRPFNVKVSELRPGYADAVRRAVEEGLLDGYVTAGNLYVNYGELSDLIGPGSDTIDLDGGCYIPPGAIINHDPIS